MAQVAAFMIFFYVYLWALKILSFCVGDRLKKLLKFKTKIFIQEFFDFFYMYFVILLKNFLLFLSFVSYFNNSKKMRFACKPLAAEKKIF